jgi:hypothetical protein
MPDLSRAELDAVLAGLTLLANSTAMERQAAYEKLERVEGRQPELMGNWRNLDALIGRLRARGKKRSRMEDDLICELGMYVSPSEGAESDQPSSIELRRIWQGMLGSVTEGWVKIVRVPKPAKAK